MANEKLPFDIKSYTIGQDLSIDASAGTGKTFTIELLTEKMVDNGIPLSKILIVTYTVKATGELRDRIRKKMESCLAEKIKANKDAANFRRAVQDIHSAPIFTIHSFCQNTLQSFSFESNSPLDTGIVDDKEACSLIEKIIRDEWTLLDDFKNFASESDFKADDFKAKCINALKMASIAEDAELRYTQYKSFDDLIEKHPGFKENFEILEKYKTTKVNTKTVNDFYEAIHKFDSSKNSSLFNGGHFQKKSWLAGIGPEELNNAVEFFFDKKEITKTYSKDEDVFILAHVKDLQKKWEALKNKNKQQSYDNMIKSVRNAVMPNGQKPHIPSPLTRQLRNAYQVAIIDEFQDTNQKQWDIFETVFKDSSENSLIVVGDPKQSIYNFQGADLEVYNKAIETFGDNCKKLEENNRSSDILIHSCNSIFKENFFSQQEFSPSKVPPVDRKKTAATLNGKEISPVWIVQTSKDTFTDKDFAKYTAQKIIECCKKQNGKTALQVYDKDKKMLRDVKLSDFAILTRTHSEMEASEQVLSQTGIPFSRYKDTNLFSGREAFQWISILSAIDAPSFSGSRKKIFNQALYTDFFRISVDDVEKKDLENPSQWPMSTFIKWKALARKYKWAELQECIYNDSKIVEFLSTPKSLQSLAKIRQIGSYIFNYLYSNQASLEEAIKHLKGISSSTEAIDETDGDLIAKDNDFDAVQIMTIYAAKGLAFPIVIVPGGLKGDNNLIKGPFLYRDGDKKIISFDALAKSTHNDQNHIEWQRLLYVAYTRPQSLMILPIFTHKASHPFEFLSSRLIAMNETNNWEKLEDQAEESKKNNLPWFKFEEFSDENWNNEEVKKQVDQILKGFDQNKDSSSCTMTEQQQHITDLQKNLGNLSIFQYSYSSLANKKKAKEKKLFSSLDDVEDLEGSDGRVQKEETFAEDTPHLEKTQLIDIDKIENLVQPCQRYDKNVAVEKIANYPRGAKLGNALHESLEHIDFIKFGQLKSEDESLNDSETLAIIEERFAGQSFAIKRHPDWLNLSAKHIWNTLNASLPEIRGSKATGNEFSLNELDSDHRKAEMEFRLNAQYNDWMNRFCKGFMDLLFVREDADHNLIYSILDWKSDVLGDDEYANKESIYKKVTEEYSVQRVLYSYCLIQWLMQFYGPRTEANLTEAEIFEKYYGGIYYAFVRGCKKGTCNGIYAQTWESYDALCESYKHVVGLMG